MSDRTGQPTRRGRGGRRARGRPRRPSFVDYYANTSLDESDNTFAPPELGAGFDESTFGGPGLGGPAGFGGPAHNPNLIPLPVPDARGQLQSISQRRQEIQARIREIEAEERRLQQEVEYEERQRRRQQALQEMQQNATNSTARRRRGRLERYQRELEHKQAVFNAAVGDWMEQDPEGAEKFRQMADLCLAASSTTVRTFALIHSLPGMPDNVASAVRALCEHFHAEARLKYELAKAEERVYGLHPEVKQAAKNTTLIISPCEVHVEHITIRRATFFGTGTDLASLLEFENYEDDRHYPDLTARQILLKIQANFFVRKLRIETEPPSDVTFEHSSEHYVMEWHMQAIDFMQEPLDNLSDGDLQLHDRIQRQLNRYADSRNWFCISDNRNTLDDFQCRADRFISTYGGQKRDQLPAPALGELDRLQSIYLDLAEFENKYGMLLGVDYHQAYNTLLEFE